MKIQLLYFTTLFLSIQANLIDDCKNIAQIDNEAMQKITNQSEYIKAHVKDPMHLQHLLNILFFSHKKLFYTLLVNQSINQLSSAVSEFRGQLESNDNQKMVLEEIDQLKDTMSACSFANKCFMNLTDYFDQTNDSCKHIAFENIALNRVHDTQKYCDNNKMMMNDGYKTTSEVIKKHLVALTQVADYFEQLGNDSFKITDQHNKELIKTQYSYNLFQNIIKICNSLERSTQKAEAFSNVILVRTMLMDAIAYEQLFQHMKNQNLLSYCKTMLNTQGILEENGPLLPELLCEYNDDNK